MGMRDESWCGSCGCSQPYSEDVVTCGECVTEENEKRSLELINYIKLHLISLQQDSEELAKKMDSIDDLDSDEYKDMEIQDISLNGQMIATQHLMSVVNDILHISNERVN